MAISANVVWEVESGGSDTNGGGFLTGASGTDWSQQAAAQYSVVDAVTAGTTTITSATANFGTDVVGNVAYVTGGTGAVVAGWYQIISRTNATTIVVDRSTGLTAGTGVTLHIGGAFATIQVGLNLLAPPDQILYVKGPSYSISAVLTLPTISPSNYYTRIIGYTTTRGDGGKVTVTQTAGANGINLNQQAISLQNFIFDGSSGTGLIGINGTANYQSLVNVYAKNWATNGILHSSGNSLFYKCEVSGTTTGYGLSLNTSACIVSYCYIHNNSGTGGVLFGNNGSGGAFVNNVVANNTNLGVKWQQYNGSITNNLFYGNGSDGLAGTQNTQFSIPSMVTGNLFAKNGGFGFNNVSNSANSGNAYPYVQYNGFWSNTSGAQNHLTLDATNVLITGTDPTNDPFTAKGSQDWTLNNTAGAGALLRAAGFPGVLPGLTPTGYPDIGAYQHQDAGGTTIYPIFD